MNPWFKTLVVSWFLLSLLQAVLGAALLDDFPTPEGSPLWIVASNLLTVAVLSLLAASLPAGRTRAAVLFAFWGGVQANNLVEAAFFDLGIPGGLLARMAAHQLLVSAGVVLALDRLAPASAAAAAPPPAPSPLGWVWRVAACDVLYVFLYLSAGLAVFPFVEPFYAERTLPDPGSVVTMQVFRGLVLTALTLVLARRLAGGRSRAALLTGLALSVLGGVAPLLAPNPFMPPAVRYAHLIEVSLSNFAFAWLAARLLRPCPATRQVLAATDPVGPAQA